MGWVATEIPGGCHRDSRRVLRRVLSVDRRARLEEIHLKKIKKLISKTHQGHPSPLERGGSSCWNGRGEEILAPAGLSG